MTNLKPLAIVGFLLPIHIIRQVYIACLSLKCQKTADCVSKYSRVMIFAAIEPPQYIVVAPTSGKRIDRHDQGFDDFAVGGFGRWSIGLRASLKPILQRNS